ncbi:MAG: nitroreductase family protein [Acidobacteriota bacterium]
MNKRSVYLALALLLAAAAAALAQNLKPIPLPKPQAEGGKPLMQALKERKSARDFSPEKLPLQVLSSLLWAGFGINRPDGHRTAPSARNVQDIDIYAATADGLYVYDAKAHALLPVVAEDVRGATGTQPFVREAPLNLIYVSDQAKMKDSSAEDKLLYAGAHTGFIAQNVYLYCASEGLSVVVRALVDRAALAKAMKLRPDQRVTLAQTIGYPKK